MLDVPRCPRCGTQLEEDARFCHGCGTGLDPVAPALPLPAMPLPMMPMGPGMMALARPVDRDRAVAAIASILMFFTAVVALIIGILYILNLGWAWEERWNGERWVEERVILWQWLLYGIFDMATFGVGVAGGAFAARGIRLNVALAGGVLLLVSALAEAYVSSLSGSAYFTILAITVLGLLVVSRRGFSPEGEPQLPQVLPDRGAPYGRMDRGVGRA